MSHYETPEQRQIRELRTKISAITSQANNQASQNNTLRRELDVLLEIQFQVDGFAPHVDSA